MCGHVSTYVYYMCYCAEELVAMVGIKKDQSVTIDLTSQQLVVRTLTEAKITCGEEDKVRCVYCWAGVVC